VFKIRISLQDKVQIKCTLGDMGAALEFLAKALRIYIYSGLAEPQMLLVSTKWSDSCCIFALIFIFILRLLLLTLSISLLLTVNLAASFPSVLSHSHSYGRFSQLLPSWHCTDADMIDRLFLHTPPLPTLCTVVGCHCFLPTVLI